LKAIYSCPKDLKHLNGTSHLFKTNEEVEELKSKEFFSLFAKSLSYSLEDDPSPLNNS